MDGVECRAAPTEKTFPGVLWISGWREDLRFNQATMKNTILEALFQEEMCAAFQDHLLENVRYHCWQSYIFEQTT